MLISVIAPMYNEEANIIRTYNELEAELSRFSEMDYEILFIDDGSTDNSLTKAEKLAAEKKCLKVYGYPKNQGRGMALRTGFENAKGDLIITIDFDLSYSADHIGKMIDVLVKESDIDAVFVSAYMPGGMTVGVPKFRLFVSKIGNLVYRNVFSTKIYTSTCVVRGYRRDAIKYLLLTEKDKEIHLEIISKLLANGFNIKEIPGILTKRSVGKSKFKFSKTSISHLIYFIHEKPFMLFGLIGVFFIVLGIISSGIIFYTRFAGDSVFEASFVGRIVSPNFVILNYIFGFQFIAIGFLGLQNSILKKEFFRVQKQIEFHFSKKYENKQ